MTRLRTPLLITAIYYLLIGLTAFFPSLVRSVSGYDVQDTGLLLSMASWGIGFGLVTWAIAANADRYGGLAPVMALALAISVVVLLYGLLTGVYTVRAAGPGLVIGVVLAVWIWSAGPKA